MSSFELSPGVVVDPDRSEVYVMSPRGGIAAVDLTQGAELWHSQDAAKPLALSGDLLVSQAEAAGPNNELAIVTLHTREGGAPVAHSLVELQPGVEPAIQQTSARAFTAQAQTLADDAAVSWEFVAQPLRGMAPSPTEVLPGEESPSGMAADTSGMTADTAGPDSSMVVARGAALVRLADGAVTAMELPAVADSVDAGTPGLPAAAAPSLADDERLAGGLPGPQFLSADGRHVLTSTQVDDDSVWDKYSWRIQDRSGERLGEIRAHVRFAPFFVSGSQVVYQTEPYARLVGTEIVEEPVQIRAVDLRTGESLWSQAVRDIIDREPPPP